jgi:hypothetical protein
MPMPDEPLLELQCRLPVAMTTLLLPRLNPKLLQLERRPRHKQPSGKRKKR